MKTSPEQTTRLLYQLRHNLMPKSETQQIKDYSDEAKDILRREGFEEVVKNFNDAVQRTGYDKFCLEDFENAKLFPDDEFAREYQNKHTVYPIGFGVIVPIKQWESIARKIKTKSDGSAFDGIQFVDSKVYLNKLGFIIHSEEGNLDINKEHELMHIDNDVYSANHTMLRQFNEGIKFEGTYVQDRIENEVKRELIAYRNGLIGEADKMAAFLSNKRLGFYVDWLASYFPDPRARQAIAYLLSPLRTKIKPATEAMEYLTKEIPSKLLTPLLFTIGPTPEEIKQKKMISTLDDIVRLAYAYSEKELKTEQISIEIKNKGYNVD